MQFIKQNTFLVILGASVLVIAVVMLAVKSSAAPTAELKLREEVSQRLAAKASSNLLNRKMIEDHQAAAANEEARVKKEIADVVLRNRDGFKAPALTVNIGGQQRQVVTFPFNQQQWQENALYWPYSEWYLGELARLRQSMSPAAAPTAADLDARRKALAPVTATPGAMPGGMVPGDWDPMPMGPKGMAVPLAMGGSNDPVAKMLQDLWVERAATGRMYVGADSFDSFFAAAVPTATPEQLWQSLVNLWVQQEIVAAINKTNEEGGGKDVTASPVKRLVKVDVMEQCFVSGSGAPSGMFQGGPAGGTPMPTFEEFGPPPVWPGAGGGGAVSVAAPTGTGSAGALTGMSSCRDYDVIRYNFTVVMAPRHLLALQRNLMARNLHTILKVDMVAPEKAPAMQAAGAPAAAAASSPVATMAGRYYYGPEAVMQITVSAQLLLLTAWDRGTWDSEKNAWSPQYPPLMPVEALRLLPADALRQEDTKRISG